MHTLNGSGLAVGRTLIAVLENYQHEDGIGHGSRRAAALYGRARGDRPRWLMKPIDLARRASSSPTTTASTRPASRRWIEIARELSRDVWVVAPEQEQSGAGHSLTLPRPIRLPRGSETALSPSTARRPIACCWRSSTCCGPAARPRAVGRQSRQQHRRRRHLFGHRRGGDGRRPCSACPSIAFSQAYTDRDAIRGSGGLRRGSRPAVMRRCVRRRLAAQRADQRQLSRRASPAAVNGVRVTHQGMRGSATI